MFASGSNAPMLDLSFPTEVVVTGLKFTTHKDRALQRVRIRANSDPANPDDFETPPQPLHSIQNVSQHRNASIKIELFQTWYLSKILHFQFWGQKFYTIKYGIVHSRLNSLYALNISNLGSFQLEKS